MSTTDPSSEAEVQATLDAMYAKIAAAHYTLTEVLQTLGNYGYQTQADLAMSAVVRVEILRYELFRAKGGQL